MSDYLCNLNINKCIICNEKDGCFIECSDNDCILKYHILCGWFNAQYMQMYINNKNNNNINNVLYQSYTNGSWWNE